MVSIDFGAINYVAIAVSAIMLMVLGFTWYAPFVFGRVWMAALGKAKSEISVSGRSRATVAVLADAILSSLMLAVVFQVATISRVAGGVIASLSLAVAVSGISIISHDAFERRSPSLMLIDIGYRLVGYLFVGIILSVW